MIGWVNPAYVQASGPDNVTGLNTDNLVEVVYEVTVMVPQDQPSPGEEDVAQGVVDHCPWIASVKVQRA